MTTSTPQILPAKRSEDVVIYIRHSSDCTATDASEQNPCGCPLWLYLKKTQRRTSARTTSWTQAKKERETIILSYDPLQKELTELRRKREYESITLLSAVTKFENWKRSEGCCEDTITDYMSSVNQMKDYMHSRGIGELREITHEIIADWKADQWKTVKRSNSQKKFRTHIRMFFGFCSVQQRWLDKNDNPADALLTSKAKTKKQKMEEVVPAIPFYEDQYQAILEAALHYDEKPRSGMKRVCTPQKFHALIQLMRWSGLAIRDAVNLKRDRIKDGILTIRRAKTNEKVTLPLKKEVLDELYALPVVSDGFFYDNDHSSDVRARTACYGTAFCEMFKTVQWPSPVVDGDENPVSPHSHMLRHTFAYWWLVTMHQSIRDLQLLLGHASLKTTESTYAQIMGKAVRDLNDRFRLALGEHPSQQLPEPEVEEPEHRVRIRVRHATADRFRSIRSR